MKVWLDDQRIAPEGWTHLDHPDKVVEMLQHALVEEISLDHDLGIVEDGRERTGYDVLLWIEERCFADPSYQPPTISIHTSNSSAYRKMAAARASIRRLSSQYV